MNRNTNARFSNVPTPTMPRYKRDLGYHKKDITMKHGRLTPWYTRLVYPHSNLKMDMNNFIRMDTSVKVPLDEIYLDNYFFFVPLRIILGKDRFEKILGHKTAYDTNTYNFPMIHLQADTSDGQYPGVFFMNHDSLIQYMGYGALTGADSGLATWQQLGSGVTTQYQQGVDEILNACNLAAFYIVYNEYFRDENLDPEFPVEDLLAGDVYLSDLYHANSMWDNFRCPKVNRYHDIFSSGLISPIKGANGDVTIPLGFSIIPVTAGSTHDMSSTPMRVKYSVNGGNTWLDPSGQSHVGQFDGVFVGASNNSTDLSNQSIIAPSNLWADASAATGPSVRQLYNSLALFSLYDKRGTFGTRLIEQIRGSFGLEVPDGLVDRAEYLGGSNQSLNNIPVLNTTSTNQGAMVGNSVTLTGMNSFDKGFNEWGIVIGMSCTRIKHSYPQGIQDPTWILYDNLDLYWPEFANIGKVGIDKCRICNTGGRGQVFNYNDPHIDQDTEMDTTAGDFGPFRAGSNDLANYWSYQDIYQAQPSFNAGWLKEDNARIAGTLTSTLIPYASDARGHQFMVRYNFHSQLTIAKPLHPHAPNITGRI